MADAFGPRRPGRHLLAGSPPDRRGVLAGGLAALALAGPGRAFGAGPPAPLRAADAFVDSVGVNVHVSSEPYVSRAGRVADLLTLAGLRHVRDEVRPGADVARWRGLYDAHGVRAHLLVSPTTATVPETMDFLAAVGPHRLTALEGQNEGDSDWFMAQAAARPTWHEAVVSHQRAVYRAVRAAYRPAELPMLSPTVLNYKTDHVALIAPAAPACDLVALHSYVQEAQEPETRDAYASLDWYLANFRDPFRPDLPAMATEMGYCNLVRPGGTGVSETASGIYLPRMLLNNFAAGLRRTFLYELLDADTAAPDWESHWGLVHTDGTPKPAYLAVSALLNALTDRGAPRAAAPPPGLSLPGAGPEARSLALARRDGGIVVAVWRAVRCWDRAGAADIAVPPVPMRLACDRPLSRARVLEIREGTAWRDAPLAPGADGGSEVALSVGPRAVLVWLTERQGRGAGP